VSSVAPLNRTLEQELYALLRGAQLECLVCGEFVLHCVDGIRCPECGAQYGEAAQPRLQLDVQAG
jgi:Zn finger protein HypA/HybF involved in hydrogenase expression